MGAKVIRIMNEKIERGKITPEDIYTSRLTEHKTTNSEGWTRWVKVAPPKSTGNPVIDELCGILAQTPVPSRRAIAVQMGVALADLHALMRVYAGMSMDDFLVAYRMLVGEELLRCTDVNVQDIAWCVGYSRSVFTPTFERAYGISPRDYRLQKRAVRFAEYYRWNDDKLKKKA